MARNKKYLLALMIISPAAYATIGELNQLGVLSIDANCACYPGLSAWGYALDALAVFLILNVFAIPAYFSDMLPRYGLVVFVLLELVTYGWAAMLFIRNLSTTEPTPNLFVLISVVPVALLLALGYVLKFTTGMISRRSVFRNLA